ncbi:MAG TPA: sugar phosphate isomerase/epimerase [Candidatus Limnocylindria bacterium]|nr:sugar phosphate isomerase/epimerase [Candidatus Limnocylindria bacterium]
MAQRHLQDIRIGTCVPGPEADQYAPAFLDMGYEALSVNFHMEFSGVNIEEQGRALRELAESRGARVTTLGVYSNPVQFEDHVTQLERAIDAAHLYGADIVSTFAGAYEGRPVSESFTRFGEVFRGLCSRAQDKGVRIALENCPMGGTWNRATCNIAFTPKAWEAIFNEVPSPALGLEWEPAHQMIQLIDPIAQLRKWVGKVVHLHGKDASVDLRAVADDGILFPESNFAPQRTVGFGDCDWRLIITILRQHGFTGDIAVEGFHDPVYRWSLEMEGQRHALAYLLWCRGGAQPA